MTSHLIFAELKNIKDLKFNIHVIQDHILREYFYYIGQGDLQEAIVYNYNKHNDNFDLDFKIKTESIIGDSYLLTDCGAGEHFSNGNGMCTPYFVSWIDVLD